MRRILAALLCVALTLSGCASTVTINVEREAAGPPAPLDEDGTKDESSWRRIWWAAVGFIAGALTVVAVKHERDE